MLGWNSQARIKIAGEISTTSDRQMTPPPYGRKRRGAKEPPDESERGEWKAGLWRIHFDIWQN